MLFSELYKIKVNKVTFVGFRGGDRPNRLLPGSDLTHTEEFGRRMQKHTFGGLIGTED